MVWFQCEDCGENLKKPKLPNHFRMCSATKLSCIDCGKMFDQQSVQSHTQCISEVEKYGPKDQGKSPHGAQQKPNKPKSGADIDVNVGLSSRPPWSCSLCNTTTTSKQTLLSHADGKKHRAKARAYHAAQNQASPTENQTPSKDCIMETVKFESNGTERKENLQTEGPKKDHAEIVVDVENEKVVNKRKHNVVENGSDGEVIQAEDGSVKLPKKNKHSKADAESAEHLDGINHYTELSKKKIKWKKIVTSILEANSDEALKIKRLQKLALKVIKDSGVEEDEALLQEKLMAKIASSSRFVIENKCIRLMKKTVSSF